MSDFKIKTSRREDQLNNEIYATWEKDFVCLLWQQHRSEMFRDVCGGVKAEKTIETCVGGVFWISSTFCDLDDENKNSISGKEFFD